jgi:regulator of protease activity HflC (stomatin/prohibitin superfamily)
MPVNGVLEYLWFRDNDPWWATILRAVTLIALVVLFAFKGMHKVPSGSKALRTRFNKVVHYRRDIYDRLGYTVHHRGDAKVVGPGLVIGIPFVHNVMIESITEQFEPLPPMIRLQPLREVGSQINFRVIDLEKALVGE